MSASLEAVGRAVHFSGLGKEVRRDNVEGRRPLQYCCGEVIFVQGHQWGTSPAGPCSGGLTSTSSPAVKFLVSECVFL